MDSIPSKILIRTPNWLGDLIMSTGFLRAVLEIFPDSQVDIILKSGFEIFDGYWGGFWECSGRHFEGFWEPKSM